MLLLLARVFARHDARLIVVPPSSDLRHVFVVRDFSQIVLVLRNDDVKSLCAFLFNLVCIVYDEENMIMSAEK